MEETQWLEWLHELTTQGYAEDITIETQHEEQIKKYYAEGKPPAEALTEYKRYRLQCK